MFLEDKIFGFKYSMALFLFLVLSLCIPCYIVDADSKSQQSFTTLQEFKNIQLATKDNEFDCVDIYKQPAFRHPLLKNHKIQLNPSFARDTTRRRSSYINKAFKGDSFTCPPGKVPIQKKAIKHQTITDSSSKKQIEDFYQYSQSNPGHHFATLDTTQNTTYHGANGFIGVFNLSLQANQYSFSQIWLQSGPPTELNSIQIGYSVHPSLYGDSQTRITAYWTADGYKKTGCFNVLCPGFVQVNPTIALGSIADPASTIGSNKQFALYIKVKQDPLTGHWWLTLTKALVQIGYWPKEIFTHLNQGSSLIRYGGETFAPPNMISPPMGSGRLPKELFKNSAFIANLEIVDSQYNENEVKPEDMKSYIDTSSNCYDLLYHGYEGEFFEQAFLFGGPGGQCGI